eukprot:TRINITY_DN6569_c0_g1_i3.p1 TRINITY_DN6569_c0_g1~~TRINITY_DN6569_c0_g1_i3.p1  ORF type:complete len:302 (-),score=91.32 TRINITY_DN6569_c0_g1_i3:26-931(-)
MGIVFLNKYLMTSFPNVNGPMFITWFQFVVALACVYILGFLGTIYPIFSFVPPFEFNFEVAKQVAPLTCVNVTMIMLNNFCLKYVEVSFYQVARSLTICFNILFTYTVLQQETSTKAIQACAVVIIGFVLGSKGEVKFSWLGIIFGVSASCFVSLNSIFVKKTLPIVDKNQWVLLGYNTAMSIVFLFPFVLMSGDLDTVFNYAPGEGTFFWQVMMLTGVFGFLINIAIFLQIKHTSPLTHNISGTAKACVQTVLSILIYGNPVPFMNAMGIFLTIAGSAWYSQIRYQEMQRKLAEESGQKV